MSLTLKLPRFLRSFELAVFLVGLGMAVSCGMSIRWVGFSRILGTYLGAFFPPIALLEVSALAAERYWPEKMVPRSILLGSLLWTLLLLLPVVSLLSDFPPPYYRGVQTSLYLWRVFPDSFSDLIGGSAIILTVWILPVAILSGGLQLLKRRREDDVRWGLILTQLAFLSVVVWAFILQKSVHSKLVNVAGGYFSPFEMGFAGSLSIDVIPILNVGLVLLFWCLLFVVLRYCVRYFGVNNSLIALLVAVAAATVVIFLPYIPPVPLKRGVDFVQYSGWYRYRVPHLIPLRIWAASLLFVGMTVVVAGIGSLLRRERSTVQAG